MEPTYPDPVVPDVTPGVTVDEVSTAPADLQPLRWGPIWGGLLTAIGIFFLLTLLAVGIGLQDAPVTAAEGERMGFIAAVVTSAIALVSFFIGGFVSSWAAGLTDQARSLLNGFLVWALWLVGVIVLAAFGLGSFVGAVGEVFGRVAVEVPEVDVTAIRDSAWQTFLALVLTAAASALGGLVGAREELRAVWPRVISVRPRT